MKPLRRITAAVMASAMAMSMGITCYAGEWTETGGQKMYKDDEGNYLTGKQEIDGDTYYFDSKGIMKTGWLSAKSGKRYYFDKKSGIMRTGWMKATSGTYYFGKNGLTVTGEKKIGGSWYLFDDKGVMQTGWQGDYYYLSGGKRAVNTSLTIDGVKYRFDSKGKYTELGARPSAAERVEEEPVYPTEIYTIVKQVPMRKGTYSFIEYKFKPLNANVTDVTFSSSNTKIVSIDDRGEMYAVEKGTCTVTVTSKHDSSLKVSVTVKVTDS